jgi:hypothetical protein
VQLTLAGPREFHKMLTLRGTRLMCDQRPDTETSLALMSEERKVRDVALAR